MSLIIFIAILLFFIVTSRLSNMFILFLIRKKKYQHKCNVEFRRAALTLLNDRFTSPDICDILRYMNDNLDSKKLMHNISILSIGGYFRNNATVKSPIFEFVQETIGTLPIESRKLFYEATVNFMQSLICSTPVLGAILIRTTLWWIRMNPSLGLFIILLASHELSHIPREDHRLKRVA